MIVLDRGALYAALVETELRHAACRKAAPSVSGPLLLSPFALCGAFMQEWGCTTTLRILVPSDEVRTLDGMEQPTRIDLLELDIDLRLAELWREAADVCEWNLEVISAFMRAAYGKGYCDALTEEAPGSLCLEHGYDVPRRRERDAARG